MLGSSLVDNFLLTMNGPHVVYHVLQRFTKETLESLPILSLRKGRARHVPDSFNHPLYLNTLLGSSNPGPKPEHNERFARQYRHEHPPEFPLTLPFSGCMHHLSSPNTLSSSTVKITVGRRCHMSQAFTFHCACSAHKHRDTQTHRHTDR